MSNASTPKLSVVIVGGGPAGLTASFQLMQADIPSTVLEKDHIVGGISRTATYKGYRFDIGGHRFFTKVKEVDAFWHQVLHEEFLRVNRLSRIYYQNRFFDYPLKPFNALTNLGLFESLACMVSYLWAQLFPKKPETNFETWITNRFGKRLFNTFFKTYTEKVWGIPCNQIQAEWAAQRIKGLSLWKAVYHAFFNPQKKETSLIDAFHYPKLGPGQMWETVEKLLNAKNHPVVLNTEVKEWRHEPGRISSILVQTGTEIKEIHGSHFISSAPMRELIQRFKPVPPREILEAAEQLHYRDFLVVSLIIQNPSLFPDNWIYIHSPEVRVGRIQNFKNWSPEMVPDPSKTCLGMEYFCFQGDDLWTMPDHELVALARKEIAQLGLAKSEEVVDGTVVRMEKAYPVYDEGYSEALQTIRNYLSGFSNLQLVGRNGMHRYNNQDHSMLTAMLAVKNILGESHNLWTVNVEQEYHEEGKSSERLVPKRVSP
jgi:protoporphyrinogen oxidase